MQRALQQLLTRPARSRVRPEWPATHTGRCGQVFDKALSEPTFSALYAQLCHFLSSELPDFTEADPETGEPKKVTFRRIILNKCQSEFEKGAEAMAAVEGREQKAKEKGEDDKVRTRLHATSSVHSGLCSPGRPASCVLAKPLTGAGTRVMHPGGSVVGPCCGRLPSWLL